MYEFIENVLYEYSYPVLFGFALGYFGLLYFGLAPLFLWICRFLERSNLLHTIEPKEVKPAQIAYEIKHSVQSIFVFGLSIIPVIYLVRRGAVSLLPDTPPMVLIGVIILSLWNEVHFFLVHRLMHSRFFMRHVHFVHHRSKIPTVFSVYSFHWAEAWLLSTVPLTIVPFIPFSIVAVFLYPLASVLINYAGHCNYRFGQGDGEHWLLLGTYHHQHHSKGRKNYGFALRFLDKLLEKLTS